jgi:ABC-2 type transport system ATP-binding protein
VKSSPGEQPAELGVLQGARVVVEVDDLRKTYGDFAAVRGVSFEVAEGEIFGLLGPNGAGKTTTVECLQGLRRADGGRLRVLGLDPRTQTNQLRQRIGCQLQESALPDRMKVWEALDLFSSFSPGGADWRSRLEQWGLARKRTTSFAGLSGGEQQRLFVALALVNEPEVVFLDELTQGLDPAARRVAWDLIRVVRDRGSTVVLVTHYMDEAEKLCDRLAVIDRGKVVACDTPQGLIGSYGGPMRVVFSVDGADVSWLGALPNVDRIERHGRRIEVTGTGPVLALVAAELVGHGITPSDLRAEQASLEDVFLAITGHAAEEGS